jgi:hypothetical protein
LGFGPPPQVVHSGIKTDPKRRRASIELAHRLSELPLCEILWLDTDKDRNLLDEIYCWVALARDSLPERLVMDIRKRVSDGSPVDVARLR